MDKKSVMDELRSPKRKMYVETMVKWAERKVLISEGSIHCYIAKCPYCKKQLKNVSRNSVRANMFAHIYRNHEDKFREDIQKDIQKDVKKA